MRKAMVAGALVLAVAAVLVPVLFRALRGGDRTLLAWTSGELPAGLAAAARRIDGVGAVAEVRNGTAWLSAWSDDDGARSSARGSGMKVPVEVAAIDAAQYAAVLPSSDRDRFRTLSRNEALLGSTGARLRGIRSTGSLEFGDHRLSVRGVVDDELVASHEVVVTQPTGSALGITTPRYLLVALERGSSAEDVEAALRKRLPRDDPLKVRVYGDEGVLRPGDPVLSSAHVKAKFGEFAAAPREGSEIRIEPKWILANTANAEIPLVGKVRCHKAILPQMQSAFRAIEREGLGDKIRGDDFGGCFAPRRITADPDSPLSHHAWGIGFDVNVSENPYGQKPSLDARVVEIMQRWGFVWGGRWLVPDGMHFEYLDDDLDNPEDE